MTDNQPSGSAAHYVVTGAATGIGRATVHRLVSTGARVTGIGLDEEIGTAEEKALRSRGLDYVFRPVDVSVEAQVRQFIEELSTHNGGLNGIANCAGIYPPDTRLEDLALSEFRDVLEVNLIGTFLMCRGVLPLLRTSGGGSIVNVSSVHAIAAAPGQPAYAASKAAIVALTRQIAIDYATDRVRANSVLVGSVDTRITQQALAAAGGAEALGLSFEGTALGRIASPEEVADVIAFLLEPQSSFINASALLADGGLTSRIL